MHARKRPRRLASVLAIRLSKEQAAGVLERARQTGQTNSEWGRQTILQALEISIDTRLLLSETLALRKIVLALHLDLLQNHVITEQRVLAILENADATKVALAESRIHSMRSQYQNEQRQ